MWLARRLLQRRSERFSLRQLSHFFGTSCEPCHRALPDAIATAEILVALLGLAQERGARTLAEVVELAAPRARRCTHAARSSPARPRPPASTSSATATSVVLYVGKARSLRARLRSYFAGDRQRPAVEAALGAVARIEWRELGSELEASLEELRLIARAPPARERARCAARSQLVPRAARRALGRRLEARPLRPDLRASAGRSSRRARSATSAATTSRRRSRRSARSCGASPRDLRFEDAARLRDRVAALEEVAGRVSRARPSALVAAVRARARARARIPARLPRLARAGPRARPSRSERPGGIELESGLAIAAREDVSYAPEDAAALLVVAAALRHPAPELRILPLDGAATLAA